MSKGLGRGFGALLPSEETFPAVGPDPADTVRKILIDQIVANPSQPRKEFDQTALTELSESIKEKGIIQPILVEKVDSGYQIVAGERRYRAAKLAGLQEVPVLVRSFTDEERLEVALIENIQRSDLTPLEEARAYRHLMEAFNLTQEIVAQKVGKQRSTVANSLRLLKLPEEMLAAVEQGSLTPGHARAILAVNNANDQKLLYSTIIAKRMNVREAEVLANQLNQGVRPNTPSPAKPKIPELAELEQRMIDIFGTKVQIKGNGKKGSIEIAYFSEDDLSRIYELLNGKNG